MKKLISILIAFALLGACNNSDQGGTVDDGIKTLDSNGALQDTAPMQSSPTIDTARADDRVDTERRDTSVRN
jgi:hypothetical protein